MRRLILYMLILMLVFTGAYMIWGFIFDSRQSEPNYNPSIVIKNNIVSQRGVAQKLMDTYLDSFTSHGVDKQLRIKDYYVFYTDIQKQIYDGFVFTVLFSVKPAIYESRWNAGNGSYNEKSKWIEGKFAFVRVRKDGDRYTFIEANIGGF